MSDRYLVRFENLVGGELDSRTVETEEEISAAVRDIALNCIFAAGDVIRIIDLEDK